MDGRLKSTKREGDNTLEVICKKCGEKMASVENGMMIQATMKCLCGFYFGVSNVRNRDKLEYL